MTRSIPLDDAEELIRAAARAIFATMLRRIGEGKRPIPMYPSQKRAADRRARLARAAGA